MVNADIPRHDGTVTIIVCLVLHVLGLQFVIYAASGHRASRILAEKRRLYVMRRSVMTNRRHNKKRKRNVSEPSDSICVDRSTAPMALLPGAGPI